MRTINAIVKGPGEMSLEILSNVFKKNKLRLEHRQMRDTKMVREMKNLQAEELNLFSLAKWSLRENILTQKLGVKSKEEK